MSVASGIYLGLAAIAVVLFVMYVRSGRLFRSMLFTGLTGMCALGILRLVSQWIAIPLAITPFSIAVSAIMGVPGVAGMLIMQLI